MIGLIGAMAVEVEGLMDLMTDREEKHIGMDVFVSGKLCGQEAVLAVCGPGKVNAALCAQSMILHYHPEWVLNLGVAGAGEAGVSIGDMVIATAAVQHDMDTSPLGDPVGLVSGINKVYFEADASIAARLAACVKEEGANSLLGVIASGDQFICDSAKKAWIADSFSAVACEMEGAAIAQTAYRNGIPFVILRAISDKADDSAEMDYPTFEAMAADHCAKVTLTMAQKIKNAQ